MAGSNAPDHSLIGRLALYYKLITEDELVEATSIQGRAGNTHLMLGKILVDMGRLTPERLDWLLGVQEQMVARDRQEREAARDSQAMSAEGAALLGDGLEGDLDLALQPFEEGHTEGAAPALEDGDLVEVVPDPSRTDIPALTEREVRGGAPLDLGAGDAPQARVGDSIGMPPLDTAAPDELPPLPPPPQVRVPGATITAGAPTSGAQLARVQIEKRAVARTPPTAAVPPAEPATTTAPGVPLAAAAPRAETQPGVPVAEGRARATAVMAATPAPVPATATPAAGQDRVTPTAAPQSANSLLQMTRGLDLILSQAAKLGASDIHVHAGSQIQMRHNGTLYPGKGSTLDNATAERLVTDVMTEEQRATFSAKNDVDFSYTITGVGRFRVNVYRQRRGVDAVFRVIPFAPPTLDLLGLPSSLARLTTFHQGLVLITGPAGCGKSSTLAALVNLINEERREHILTIEDPIEYLHPSKRCVVNQRQVSRHTDSFARALRAALREDPDVIVIGELRDLETISLAITAAETGHLVLASLHTNSTVRTINRVLDVFPPAQQNQVRAMLSESLRAVITQRLVPSTDGRRRVPALEILLINHAIANLIREDKTVQIRSILQTGKTQGMCLLDDSLGDLVKAGTITKDIARRFAEDARLFA